MNYSFAPDSGNLINKNSIDYLKQITNYKH